MAKTLTLAQVAELTEGKIIQGSEGEIFSGLNALKDAGKEDLSFFGNDKYHSDFLRSLAGAILVAPNTDREGVKSALIEVENPTWAFGKIVEYFIVMAPSRESGISAKAMVSEMAEVHAEATICDGAVIEAGAKIGARSIVGPNSVVGRMAELGEDCELKSNVSIEERCVLKNRVTIQSGAVIGSDGFGYEFVDGALKKIDQVGIVELQDDVEIGANSTIDRARFGKTIIGRGSKVDNLVQVGHNVVTGANCIFVSQSGLAGSSTLGDFVTVAAQGGVGGHLKIADQVTLTARSGALKDIKEKGVYSGMPARPIRDEQKAQARVKRLDKLTERIVALEKLLEEKG